jgi:hypothetical protein
MYPGCPVLIQKQVLKNILSFAVNITFLVLMFQIFTSISLLKIENFEPSLYLHRRLTYTNTYGRF